MKHRGWPLFMIALALLATGLSAGPVLLPTYSLPLVGERLLYLSTPHRTRIFAIDRSTGELVWARDLDRIIGTVRLSDGRLFTATESTLYELSGDTGATIREMPLQEPCNSLAPAGNEGDLLVLHHPGYARASLFDTRTGRVLHTEADVSGFLFHDKERVVYSKSPRVPRGESHAHERSWLEARRLADWSLLWRSDLKSRHSPGTAHVLADGNFLLPDNRDVLTISPAAGELHRASADLPVPPDSYVIGVHLDNGRPYYAAPVPTAPRHHGPLAYRVFFCALPDLRIAETLEFRSLALGLVFRHEDGFVSASSEETVGFGPDGERRWNERPMQMTSPLAGFSYFVDNRERRARVGVIRLSTGEMTVLHQEAPRAPFSR